MDYLHFYMVVNAKLTANFKYHVHYSTKNTH